MDDGPVACTSAQSILGEGVRWDSRREELIRVDIRAGRVIRDRVDAAGDLVPVCAYDVAGTVGAVAPVEGDDGWILAAGRGFLRLGADGAVAPIAEVAPEGTRMNDAACDPQGRFWAGSLAEDFRRGGGTLHRLDRDGTCVPVLPGMTIPNGVCWSPDGETMYVVDSADRAVYAFAFDGRDGTITDRRVFAAVAEEHGAPDGATVDTAGDLWVAMYHGGRVHRYSPAGELREVLAFPVTETTCCAFGGPGLRRLYVTTATQRLTDDERRAAPGEGVVYRLDTEATGAPALPFRPDPRWWAVVSERSRVDG